MAAADAETWTTEPCLPRCVAARLMLAPAQPHKPDLSLAQLADHKSCPPAILIGISNKPSADRASVATRLGGNIALPPAAMSGLARDDDSFLRSALARNENCPSVVIAALAADGARNVREQVAANRSCPPELLDRLC